MLIHSHNWILWWHAISINRNRLFSPLALYEYPLPSHTVGHESICVVFGRFLSTSLRERCVRRRWQRRGRLLSDCYSFCFLLFVFIICFRLDWFQTLCVSYTKHQCDHHRHWSNCIEIDKKQQPECHSIHSIDSFFFASLLAQLDGNQREPIVKIAQK